jgi:hypothetical protein
MMNFEGVNILDPPVKPEDDGEGAPLRGEEREYRITNPELRISKGESFWIPDQARNDICSLTLNVQLSALNIKL